MMASGKPQPLSLIRSHTWPPESSVDTSIFGSVLPERASCAFCSRLWITCRRRSGSPRTNGMLLWRLACIRVPDCSYKASTSVTSRFRSSPPNCGVVERARRLGREFVAEFRLESLRRELDRRERILDLVSEPARDLAPGGGALCRDQLRDVIEYHDIPTPTGLGQRRTAYENHGPTLAHLDLLLPRGSSVLFELRLQHTSKLGERVPILELKPDKGRNVLVQDAARPAVCNPQDKGMIKNEYTCRQIGENALQVCLGGFELRLIEQRGTLRLAQLLSHAVERLRKDAQLIAARDPSAARKIPARHRLGALGEHGERIRQAPRQEECERDRRKQGEQQRQGQRENVDLLQPLARQRQLLVCTIHALH